MDHGSLFCNWPVLIKGGGDLGSGVIHRLVRSGFHVAVQEIAQPTMIRRTVAFASAVYDGETTVEGITARHVSPDQVQGEWAAGRVAVLTTPLAETMAAVKPAILIDAIMAKVNTGTHIDDTRIVIALGPGFTAGVDCHAVIETERGHDLGRVLWAGQARPDSGIPGEVGGYSADRVLRAPVAGRFTGVRGIGDRVKAGDLIAYVAHQPIVSALDGVIRGLLADGVEVTPGLKVGDVDPRGNVEHCFTISDKARAIGGGVLEAILHQLTREAKTRQ